jgi:hypothetical protein
MLKLEEIVALSDQQNGKHTLSAYIPVEADTGNPGVAWRTLLRQGISRARERMADASHDEKVAFEDCAARLMDRAEQDMHAQGGGTWVGIASTDNFLYDETVPALLPSMVAWEKSARIVPYIAALQPDRALVVVVDRVHAVFYRAADGVFEEIDRIETEPRGGVGSHMSAPPKQSFHPGTRGTPGTDAADRQAVAAFKKHRLAIQERLRSHDRNGEPIIFGGASEAVAQIAPTIEANASDRFIVSDALAMTLSDAEMRSAVTTAMNQLRETRQRNLISALLSGDRHPELNVLDRKALDEALTVRNVDTLVLSRRWINGNPDDAEKLVKAAIAQNAAIEIADGEAGDELDHGCAGVAAKLRFSVREKTEEIVEEQPPIPRKKPSRKKRAASIVGNG